MFRPSRLRPRSGIVRASAVHVHILLPNSGSSSPIRRRSVFRVHLARGLALATDPSSARVVARLVPPLPLLPRPLRSRLTPSVSFAPQTASVQLTSRANVAGLGPPRDPGEPLRLFQFTLSRAFSTFRSPVASFARLPWLQRSLVPATISLASEPRPGSFRLRSNAGRVRGQCEAHRLASPSGSPTRWRPPLRSGPPRVAADHFVRR
jgi:hypothetical protein